MSIIELGFLLKKIKGLLQSLVYLNCHPVSFLSLDGTVERDVQRELRLINIRKILSLSGKNCFLFIYPLCLSVFPNDKT